jgi:hypothetical protein
MDLRYPIGRFESPASITPQMRAQWIGVLAAAPAGFRAAVKGLDAAQLDTPYRPLGWTVRQVIHHIPDSHMNAYVRFRLALTEQSPVIKPYDEAKWAELPDARTAPVETSLLLLENLHSRWVTLLESLSEADFERTFHHPELGVMRLDILLALHDWHCRHHTAHITGLRERSGWR